MKANFVEKSAASSPSWSKWLGYWIRPHLESQDEQGRAALLLVNLLVLCSSSVFYRIITPKPVPLNDAVIVAWVALYVLARTRHYLWSAGLTLGLLTAIPYLRALVGDFAPPAAILLAGLVAIGLADAIYSARVGTVVSAVLMLGYGGLHLAGVAGDWLWFYVPGLTIVRFLGWQRRSALARSRHVEALLAHQQRLQEQLRQSEARYRLLSEMIREYAYAIAYDETPQRFLWATDHFNTLTGLSLDAEATLADFEALIHPDDLPLFRLHCRMAVYGEDISEFRIKNGQSGSYWLRDIIRLEQGADGKRYLLGAAYDITELAAIQNTLKTQALQQAVIAELSQLSLSDISIAEFMEQASQLACQVLIAPVGHILTRTATGHWRCEQGFGWTEAKIAVYNAVLETAGFAPDFHPQDVIITEVVHYPNAPLAQFLADNGVVIALWAPIYVNGGLYGILALYATQAQELSRDYYNFLQSLTSLIGAFITRQRIQASEREQRLLAESLRDVSAILTRRFELKDVFDNIFRAAKNIIPAYEAGTIMLLAEDEQTISVISTLGYDDVHDDLSQRRWDKAEMPPVNHMILTREPIVIADTRSTALWNFIDKTPNIRSYLGAPIFAGEACIGVINLDSYSPNAFTLRDSEKLVALANYASIAIQNARYTRDLEARVEERTRQLRAEQEQLQAIINATGEGIFYTEGPTIRLVNEALCAITGFSAAEIIGQPSRFLQPLDITPAEIRELQSILEVVSRGETYRGEVRLRRKDGGSFSAGITISRIGDSALPSTLRTVTIVRDISIEKDLQAQKQRFIDHAAHELRSPIAGLNTRLYLMQRQPQKMDEHLRQLEKIFQRMNRLVEDLLDISRFQKGLLPLRLQDNIAQNIINDVLETYRPQGELKALNIEAEMPPAPIHILADAERLIQVMTNLLINAINYTPSGGQIRIRLTTEGDFAAIAVADNGVGISAERLPYIFEAFYRAHGGEAKGFGLGLSIVKGIVEQHGGRITVHSQEAEGSTFTVYLPLNRSSYP